MCKPRTWSLRTEETTWVTMMARQTEDALSGVPMRDAEDADNEHFGGKQAEDTGATEPSKSTGTNNVEMENDRTNIPRAMQPWRVPLKHACCETLWRAYKRHQERSGT